MQKKNVRKIRFKRVINTGSNLHFNPDTSTTYRINLGTHTTREKCVLLSIRECVWVRRRNPSTADITSNACAPGGNRVFGYYMKFVCSLSFSVNATMLGIQSVSPLLFAPNQRLISVYTKAILCGISSALQNRSRFDCDRWSTRINNIIKRT